MASIVQDRLPLNRMPLDKWTTREQLCLASAVSCSGDQNWMSVSRNLKAVCANETNSRPDDWFSHKNCALQYGDLLENVETPKRKKRTSESGSGVSSPTTVATPTDTILRRLNEERIQELKAEIRKEQEEFAQIYRELKSLQSGNLNEDQLLKMWIGIEKQQEEKRIEEMKLENIMREREQQRLEMQRNWRTLTPAPTPIESPTQTSNTDTSYVDMDVEEVFGEPNPQHGAIVDSNQLPPKMSANQPATSPLLSSLLKTPSTTNIAAALLAPNNPTGTSNNSARSSAPTITTLLTSGSIPNKNQPAITLKANIPPQKAAQILSSPISGPPAITCLPAANSAAQNLLSPSQAAPTLSMLLEKNKVSSNAMANIEDRNDAFTKKAVDATMQSQLEEIPKEAFNDNKGEIPMDLDEDIVTHISETSVNIMSINDSDEPDPNEEQQLLEVFKNIGNIDELDIDVAAVIDDEEVDFLKDMGADSPNENTNVDFDRKDESDIVPTKEENVKENNGKEVVINLEETDKPSPDLAILNKAEEPNTTATSGDNKLRKIDITSSDDSNDNIPLAAVASLEQKTAHDKVISKESTDTTVENVDFEKSKTQEEQTPNTFLNSFEEDKEHDKLEKQLADLVGENDIDETKNLDEVGNSPGSENSDVIVIPEDDSSGYKAGHMKEKLTVDAEAAKIKRDLESDVGTAEVCKDARGHDVESSGVDDAINSTNQDAIVKITPTISIADTDDDSSTTDISIVTRKEDKSGNNNSSIKHSAPQARKGLHETIRQDQQSKTDDESTTQLSSSSSSSVNLARPPLLRKLRDRDRSESPMIDGDPHTPHTVIDNLNSQRLRRRYSSTPISESIPNSPVSSDRERDELETRVSKKSLLGIFHALQYSKNASNLQRAFHEDFKFDDICLRPMDMLSIRKHIETGNISNVSELQRDIMLMCQNGLMLFKRNTTGYNAANAFMQECQAIREFVGIACSTEHGVQVKENKEVTKSQNITLTSTKSRSSSRKSQRIS
ncbi:bromodomain-containing protein 8 [Rhagoletis pomonella]|uniref:bromodomain-containing protein 8 n=1 Tax=Rhagoletis pomonella TaxID=28610 RepID=UPI00177C4887|nr:bromodomain-containing protein 8 [Rhagoletis pomonella]